VGKDEDQKGMFHDHRFDNPTIKTEILTANYPMKAPDQAKKAARKPA
jgi:hypothetical protein